MDKDKTINELKRLIEAKVSVSKLVESVRDFLEDLPTKERGRYKELEDNYHRIFDSGSLDYVSLQGLIESILELSD